MDREKDLEDFVRKQLIRDGLATGCDHWYVPRPEYIEMIKKEAEREYNNIQKNCL